MDIQDFAKVVEGKRRELEELMRSTKLKDIVGTEAVGHYKASFDNEGFTDETLNPWKEVERRKPESPWHGHSGQTGKFSSERAAAPILTGETRLLKNAIRYTYLPDGVRVSNSVPYAAVHQYGLQAKIYGKKPFTMPKRPFIGRSKVMTQKIQNKILQRLKELVR